MDKTKIIIERLGYELAIYDARIGEEYHDRSTAMHFVKVDAATINLADLRQAIINAGIAKFTLDCVVQVNPRVDWHTIHFFVPRLPVTDC